MATSKAVKETFALSLVRGEGNMKERRNSISEGVSVQLDELVKKVRGWIDDCIKNHVECQNSTSDKLPTRLLDVGPPDGSVNPKLWVVGDRRDVNSRLQNHRSLQYVALSYCWGTRPFLTTTRKTLEERKELIPMIALPRTIRDAVHFTRLLGVRYLWVDSLCILQGSWTDWTNESENMHNIYGGALVTLCASSSPDARQGVIPSSGRRYVPHGYVPHIVQEPLSRRGWALQERILSPRVVAFCTSQMVWECDHGSDFEDSNKYFTDQYGGGVPFSSKYAKRLAKSPLPQEWYAIVEDYTSRQLTYSDDRLPALAGIAKLYSKRTSSRYLAGLWEDDLQNGLLWKHISVSGISQRQSKYRAPSWSWASVDGAVEFYRAGSSKDIKLYAYAQVGCEMAVTRDLFGEILEGCLRVRGLLKSMTLTRSEDLSNEQFGAQARMLFTNEIDKNFNIACITDESGQLVGLATLDVSNNARIDTKISKIITSNQAASVTSTRQEARCLRITPDAGLLLEPTGRKINEYRRIGIFDTSLLLSGKTIASLISDSENLFEVFDTALIPALGTINPPVAESERTLTQNQWWSTADEMDLTIV